MYGDDQQAQDGGVMHMDPSVMGDPNAQVQSDQQAPQAYRDDSMGQNPVMQMHQDAVAASAAGPDNVSPVAGSSDDELMAIKQDALTALTPLVGSLDQTPEEKFKTTMMMIQASDDRSLVRAAYEAAQAIADEKVRAQALLDVVNEINYFTSHTN